WSTSINYYMLSTKIDFCEKIGLLLDFSLAKCYNKKNTIDLMRRIMCNDSKGEDFEKYDRIWARSGAKE
ncbi:MAG: hypothetical protein LUC50_09590, partial [Ruminococcus sp.]|nr:hypothetical protein [Ruminococcus sp.]